jgi:hypothetical protein
MANANDSRRLVPEERFDLVVTDRGVLRLPERVAVALRLESGEMVSMERWPGVLYLETMTAFLDALAEIHPLEERWSERVRVFLSRPVAAVEGNGLNLPIPWALFPLHPGDRVVLQVLYRGPFPELYVYLGGLAELGRALANERERTTGEGR